MRRLLFLGLAFSLAACQGDADPSGSASATGDVVTGDEALVLVDVAEPFVLAAPQGGTGGMFMRVTAGSQDITLVGARADVAERVEVHETYNAGGGMRGMREVEGGLAVPAGETVALAPGGYHIMLLNLARELAVGDTVDLELDFAQAGTVPVRVPVMSLDAMPATK